MKDAAWLEVSLTVDGELAEAAADVLARFAPEGVTTEQAVDYYNAEDEGTPVGPVTVRAYLPADGRLEETRRKLEEALYYLGRIQPLPEPVFTPIADRDWMEAWKERYRPIPIGRRLLILPAWLESPEEARIAIRIDPGMAFGTGTHPTTQLCMEFIEQCFEEGPRTADDGPQNKGRRPRSIVRGPSSVIDVGCGSGILSIAALKLGADFALGVDIDEAAVRASRENAAANGIDPGRFALGVGSVKEIRYGGFGIRNAPLVLANILAPVIVRLFEAGLAELIAPAGEIILSGILQEQVESVLAAAGAHGLRLAERRQMGDWAALLLTN
jgi:ribosomal protein L11 methyltransferase